MMNNVHIHARRAVLSGNLNIPEGAAALVLFAHGSGSGRHSPRNQFVARALNDAGLATVLADLLTSDEDGVDARTAEHRFDIALLADRVVDLVDWATGDVGLFGASTGAAAALIAAADRTARV